METETETGEVDEPDTTEGEEADRGVGELEELLGLEGSGSVAEVLDTGENTEVATKARRNEKSPTTTFRTKR